MKKLSFKILSLSILIVCLGACGGGGGSNSTNVVTPTTPTNPTTPTDPTTPTNPTQPATPGKLLTDARTGFIDGTVGATPIRTPLAGEREKIQVADAANSKVIVFMHGKDGATTEHSCPDTAYPQIAETINTLRYEPHVKILYVCSLAVDREGAQYSAEYVFGRVNEFKEIVKELQDTGVATKNIFLTGHSAGGWSALMAAAELGSENIGGVIAYAPAFAGTRLQQQQSGQMQAIRASQQKTMISQKTIHALVFAYEDDAFEIPDTLKFLKEAFPSTVNLVSQNCGSGHTTAFNDCNFTENLKLVREFVQ